MKISTMCTPQPFLAVSPFAATSWTGARLRAGAAYAAPAGVGTRVSTTTVFVAANDGAVAKRDPQVPILDSNPPV